MTTTRRDGFSSLRQARLLTSFDEVYAALGGPARLVALTGKSRTSVYNWRKAQRFPAEHYKVMRDALLNEGFAADLSIWAFTGKKTDITDVVAA